MRDGGPPHPQCGTLPSPGAGHSHADLLLGGEWAALGTIFRARDLKTLSLEWQSWATSQEVLVSALSSRAQTELPCGAGARACTCPGAGIGLRTGVVGHSGSRPHGGPAPLPQILLRAPVQGSVVARAQLQICPALSRSLILTTLGVAALLPASTCMAHPSSTGCPCPQTPAAGLGRHAGRRWQGHTGYTSPGTQLSSCLALGTDHGGAWSRAGRQADRQHTDSAPTLKKKERRSFSKVFLQRLALHNLSPKAAGTLRGSHCMCVHVCWCVCTGMHLCAYVCTNARVHMCMHLCTCVPVCLYVCVCLCVCVCAARKRSRLKR